jgi:hypothetical protein
MILIGPFEWITCIFFGTVLFKKYKKTWEMSMSVQTVQVRYYDWSNWMNIVAIFSVLIWSWNYYDWSMPVSLQTVLIWSRYENDWSVCWDNNN